MMIAKGARDMKYANGREIFPEQLLRQIQKYAAGQLVYIPAGEVKRSWGEMSGYRRYLAERNQELKAKFTAGADIERLAEAYCLSVESVKRIVYSKKEVCVLEYQCTLSSAKAYAATGRLEEWVHAYLLSDGDNKEFSDGLKLFDRHFIGPIRMPLHLFTRCYGPEEGMKFRAHAQWFEENVSRLMEVIRQEEDMPPLIVHYVDGGFELNDGNKRHEACKRLGIPEYDVIVWITEQWEYDEFMAKYGQYLA